MSPSTPSAIDIVTRKPISDALQRHLEDVLTQIPTGQRGVASVAVSTDGVEAQFGTRLAGNVTLTGYAAKLWGGPGWTAGAKAAVRW